VTNSRGAFLTTTLVGALLPPDVPEGNILRSWLDSWSGVGHVLDAMTATGHHVDSTAIGVRMAGRVLPRGHAALALDVGGCRNGPAPVESGTDGGAGRTEAGEAGGVGGWLKATCVGRVESPHPSPSGGGLGRFFAGGFEPR
jgi:hypothetical protein